MERMAAQVVEPEEVVEPKRVVEPEVVVDTLFGRFNTLVRGLVARRQITLENANEAVDTFLAGEVVAATQMVKRYVEGSIGPSVLN